MKISRIVLFGFLMIFSSLIFFGKDTEAAACKDVSISPYIQNENDNTITFKITGTPGNEVQFAISEVLEPNGYHFVTYFNMPSSGVKYITRKLPARKGFYRAYVYQYSPCSSNHATLFGFKD